jgi:hypothetical protein
VSLFDRVLGRVMLDVDSFCRLGAGVNLRSYQRQVCAAVLQSIQEKAGHSFVVMFPRQSGKNEVQAQLEAYLLAKYHRQTLEMVKVAPTWDPQLRLSMGRLRRVLDKNAVTRGRWSSDGGSIYRLGSAQITFLSGSPTSNVVGATASLLLECDEAQSVLPSKWDKDFAPMAASANTTTVFWGTAWTSKTLLARELRLAQLEEARDGVQRAFVLAADQVAQEVEDYGRHLASQVARMGRQHPFIKTQYYSEEIDYQAGMFSSARRAIMQGSHPAQERACAGQTYALLVDVAGEEQGKVDLEAANLKLVETRGRDATVVTVVQVDLASLDDALLAAPTYRVVNRYEWRGEAHASLYGQIKALVELWDASYVVIDATGIGAGLASFLAKAYPHKVIPLTLSSKSKSDLGWRFLAVVETGRYKEHVPSASERLHALQTRFWLEAEHCQSSVLDGPGRLLRWGVPESARHPETHAPVHDDLLFSASLCSLLDQHAWSTGESGIIAGIDPLEGMYDVY